ncbi:MAG TPA: hypothetical protein DIC60_02505 [Lachnospiraceae bacterium]|nr:hypothetical protein [Lachnospiraceae bacterium]
MDWEKVKRIFIWLLIVLNIGLFSENYITNRQYVMTSAQEKAIYEVLGSNGIGMYTELIKKTTPMRQLSVFMVPIETESFKSMFFGEDEDVKITLQFDKTIFASDTKSLIIQDNSIVFLNHGGSGELETFTKKTALKAADDFIKRVGMASSENIKLESVDYNDGKYIFEYNERYKDYKLFSNIKRITVSQKGVIMASAAYYKVENFVGESRKICTCDEVLLTFLGEVKKEGKTEGVYIEKIELGYDFQDSGDVADGSNLRLVPCYRIFVSGSSREYLINAYTNQIME